MLSIDVKRLTTRVIASLVFVLPLAASAAEIQGEAAVVVRLYKDFAWQAFTRQPELFGEDISHQNKAVLSRYFTPALTDLLMKDAACQIREQGICNIDSDILFDSQDPRLIDLDVQAVAPGKVAVAFKDPVTDEATRIDFSVTRVAGSWKIADIIYAGHDKISLTKRLSTKIQ